MNEEATTMTEETSVNEDDWDIDLSDLAEEEEAPSEPAEQSAEETVAETEPATEPAVPESFMLKHYSGDREVSRDEVIALAQKGIDWDAIRGERDTARAELASFKDEVDGIKELAEARGLTLAEFVDSLRASDMAQREKIDISVARGRVANQREAKRLENERTKLTTKDPEQVKAEEAKAKQDAEAREFVAEYPGVDPNSIPAGVWEDVRKGVSLVNAYRKHELNSLREENKKLKDAAQAAEKSIKNRSRSTGSQSTTATKSSEDAFFDSLWDD